MTWESSERALARKYMFFCWVLSRRIGERRCSEHLRYVRVAITVISGDWEALQTLGLSAAMPGCPVIRPPNGCQTEAPPATGAVTHAHSGSLPSRTAGPFSALLSFSCLLSSSWSTRQECPEYDETYREWRVGLPITETELRTLKEGFYCQDEVRTATSSLLLNLMTSTASRAYLS